MPGRLIYLLLLLLLLWGTNAYAAYPVSRSAADITVVTAGAAPQRVPAAMQQGEEQDKVNEKNRSLGMVALVLAIAGLAALLIPLAGVTGMGSALTPFFFATGGLLSIAAVLLGTGIRNKAGEKVSRITKAGIKVGIIALVAFLLITIGYLASPEL